MSSSPTGSDERDPPPPEHREVFVARVAEGPHQVTVCTISPLPKSERMLQSEWISALEGSFVSLDEMR